MTDEELWSAIGKAYPALSGPDDTKTTTTIGGIRRMLAKANTIIKEEARPKPVDMPEFFKDIFGAGPNDVEE